MDWESFGAMDDASGVPLHLQLERILRERIRSLKPGDRLPTEKELREHYGLSSSTVRQSLQSLVNQGLVYRKVAKGSFVAAQPIQEELSELPGFFQMAVERGLQPGGKLIEAAFVPAPEKVAPRLQIEPGEEVFKVVRVRYANGEPVCVETTFHRKQIGVLLAGEDLAGAAYYPLLEEKYGIELVAARDTIGAALATPRDAELLGIPRRSPVLTVERVTFLPQNVPSEAAFHVYRADRFRYAAWRKRSRDGSVLRLDEMALSKSGSES